MLRTDAHNTERVAGRTWLDLVLEQETWMDQNGDLVNWRLKFLDENRFVWIRSDWDKTRSTAPRYGLF